MQRRELLRLLGGAVTLPALVGLSPERLLALGRAAHLQGTGGAGSGLQARASEMIAVVAELILPESDTPGAGVVGVPAFIELMRTEWQTDDERRNFLAGLDDLDRRSRAAGAALFLELPPDAQGRLLTQLDADTGAPDSAQTSFATLKSLAVYGYFTSERIMTEVLKTPMIPGRYDGCAPLHAQ